MIKVDQHRDSVSFQSADKHEWCIGTLLLFIIITHTHTMHSAGAHTHTHTHTRTLAPPASEAPPVAEESQRGQTGLCGPSRRHTFSHQEKLDLAEDAIRLVNESQGLNGHLTFNQQLKLIAGDVKHTGRKTTGEKHANLYTWTRPEKLAELRELC